MSISHVGDYLDLTPEPSDENKGGLDEGDSFRLEIRPEDNDGNDVLLTSLTVKVINQESVVEELSLSDFSLDTSVPSDPHYFHNHTVLPYTTVFEIVTVPAATSQPYIKARPLQSTLLPTT